MGNTCYCNSTLQLLRACSEWNAYCLMKPFMAHLETLPADSTHRIILLAYQDLLTSLWSAHYPAYVRPSGFLSEVSKAVHGTVSRALTNGRSLTRSRFHVRGRPYTIGFGMKSTM